MSFTFKDDYLYCEGVQVINLVKDFETPFYLYSKAALSENVSAYLESFPPDKYLIAYAVKANNNLAILKYLASLDLGAVCVSGFEISKALHSGFEAEKVIFNGNAKSSEDMILAVQNNVLLNLDASYDVERLEEIGKFFDRKIPVLLRINPEIDPQVHPYISTGLKNSKFGIPEEKIKEIVSLLRESAFIELIGLHCHIGSQITQIRPFADAAKLMAGWVRKLREDGFNIRVLNLGGGLGISYDGKPTPGPKELAQAYNESLGDLLNDELKLIVEPGRSVVGNTAVLVSKVVGVKKNGTKNFLNVDGSMANLLRPALYNAYHRISFAHPVKGAQDSYDVVGPICESSDFLGKDRNLPTPERDDIMVVFDTGAYGYSMASNYNMHVKASELLIDGDKIYQIRRRESYNDLMRMDMGDINA